jgi:hypothetical protein
VARLLHKGPGTFSGFFFCFSSYLQKEGFCEWACLDLNQEPLPYQTKRAFLARTTLFENLPYLCDFRSSWRFSCSAPFDSVLTWLLHICCTRNCSSVSSVALTRGTIERPYGFRNGL